NCRSHPMYSSEGSTIYVTALPCPHCMIEISDFSSVIISSASFISEDISLTLKISSIAFLKSSV
ncbi:MAG: hypothetical protein AABY22_32190, partial [Nanoarchaeota archaeon]